MKLTASVPLVATVLGLLASAAFAQQTVAHYQFNPATSAPLNSYASTVTSPLGSVSLIGYPSGGGGYSSAFDGTYVRTNASNLIPESLAGAMTASHFLSFTFMPTEAVDLTALTFRFGAGNASSVANAVVYTGTWAVFSSVGGFDSVDELGTGSSSQVALGPNVFTPNWVNYNVDLTSLGTASAPVEFRIYFWDDNATASSNFQLRFDDIVLTASAAAIPEPGTYALLLGLAGVGLVAVRRRQQVARA